MTDQPAFGKKIRAMRMDEGLTQAALAEKLGISASYLNLVEHDRRPLTANLLIKLAHYFDLNIRDLAAGKDTRLEADLREVFGDPLFAGRGPEGADLRAFVAGSPDIARSVLDLYQSYVAAHQSAEALSESVLDRQDVAPVDLARQSSEQVSDLIQRYENHFPELEEEAERVWTDARLDGGDLFAGLPVYLRKKYGVQVVLKKVDEMKSVMRKYDPDTKELAISEVLRRGSRNFQIAHQVGLIACSPILDRIAVDPNLTAPGSRELCRIALANYFASAVLMPYDQILDAARAVRYDLDLLSHRFRASIEQVCHRLTSLRRRGSEGVSFSMVRVDLAGNISKRFSAGGVHFPRFSGLCPLWNVHAAFLQPGRPRVQISMLPDGTRFFSIARTVRKHRGGYHESQVLYAIALGCNLDAAKELVYADGIDLQNVEAAVPVGITCRLCERMDCKARAFPPIQKTLTFNENERGISFFAPSRDDE